MRDGREKEKDREREGERDREEKGEINKTNIHCTYVMIHHAYIPKAMIICRYKL